MTVATANAGSTAGDQRAAILLRAPNPLGDAVMALPAMAALRRAFHDRKLILAAEASVAPLFHEITPVAPDEVVTVEKRTEAATLRESGAEVAVLLPNSFRTAWMCRRAGIRERWGYRAHGRSPLLTRAIRPPRGRRHQSEYYLYLVRELGFDCPAALPRVAITPATQHRVQDRKSVV